MKAKVTFNQSGKNSVSGKITIPSILLELMKITLNDRDVNLTYEDGKLIIEKVCD